jgi:Family of unknown function (DUF5313)
MMSAMPQGILQGTTHRLNPPLWIWYTFGGRLGPRYREWVPRDVTCRTRWLRQTARAVAQIAVPAAVVSVALTGRGLDWLSSAGLPAGAAGPVVFAGLHRPDGGPAPGEAWIRAGNAEARAAGALRPRARGADRAL